jgi:hypothetical protein
MKARFLPFVIISIFFMFIIVSGIIKGISELNAEAEAESRARQEQIANVKDVSEVTTFETTDQEEANQLISEIQNSGKKIVKLDIKKQNDQNKNTPIVITITYSN